MNRPIRSLLLSFALAWMVAPTSPSHGEFPSAQMGTLRLYAMADLFVGKDPKQWDPRDPEWIRFYRDLQKTKEMGFQGITVDVWWGLVQRQSLDQFDWSYYDHIFALIRTAGLKIVPILSTHACGTNVGDSVKIPLPEAVRQNLPTYHQGKDARFQSEGGNWSDEAFGVWSDPRSLFTPFWRAFRDRYAPIAADIPQIVVSLGPAGELTYPSYHIHDRDVLVDPVYEGEVLVKGTYLARFPNRGTLQASSPVARSSFYDFLRQRHGSLERTNRAWGTKYKSFEEIDFFTETAKVQEFLHQGRQFSRMGQDFFDWYHGSLMSYGRMVTGAFAEVFGANDSHFRESVIAHKVPGVHWSFSLRLALLTAGQVRTHGASLDEKLPIDRRQPSSWNSGRGLGLEPLFENYLIPIRLQNPRSQFLSIFTCGEQPNCERHGFPGAGDSQGSKPKDLAAYDLVRAVRELSINKTYLDPNASGRRLVVQLGLENSMDWTLNFPFNVRRLEGHAVGSPNIREVTFLRMKNVVEGIEKGNTELEASVQRMSTCEKVLIGNLP